MRTDYFNTKEKQRWHTRRIFICKIFIGQVTVINVIHYEYYLKDKFMHL